MTNLKKILILALMVPILLAPTMTKAGDPFAIPMLEQPDLDIIEIPEQPDFFVNNDNQITIDEAKLNYSVVFSPHVVNGTYKFDHSDNKLITIAVKEKDDTLTTIQAVRATIKNSNGQTVAVYGLTDAYGQYAKILDLRTLALNETYTVTLTINSTIDGNDPVTAFVETTNVLTLIGIPEEEVVEDDQITAEEAKLNYSISTSPTLVNGIFKFNHDDKSVIIVAVNEKDESLTAIQAVKTAIKDSNGQIVAVSSFSSNYGQFSKVLDLTGLDINGTYTVALTINSIILPNSPATALSETTNAITLIGEGETIVDDEEEEEEDDQITIDEAKLNYYVSFSPSVTAGIYKYNTDDKGFISIAVNEKDESLTTIQAVKATIKNTNGQTVQTYSFTSLNDRYTKTLDLRSLDINGTYTVTLTINSTIDANSPATAFVETTNVLTLIGEGEVIIDDDDDDDDDVVILPNDEINNYRLMINKDTVTENNKKVFYYTSTNTPLSLYVVQDNNSSSTLNNITNVKYNIRDIDANNALVYTMSIPKTNTNPVGYYILDTKFSDLNANNRYQIEAYITYVDSNDDSHSYTKRVDILTLTPKEDSSTPTNPSTAPNEIDNVIYDINKTLMTYQGSNLYLYSRYESVNINARQSTFASNSPRVVSMTYLENGSAIKNCNDTTSCNLNYSSPINDRVELSLRVNYQIYNTVTKTTYSYSKVYSLGRHLRVYSNNTDTIPDDNGNLPNSNVTNTPSVSNDNILALNNFVLVKGTGPAVYLVNQYNNRFYIPDWSVLKSWYHTPSIMQVNDSQLSQYTLKDNVIYRPGSLIKIATDPKCYAVDLNGKLRWVYNENVARSIYGVNWNKNIYTVPDALFPSYSFGESIYNANDFVMPSLADAANMYNR